LLENLSGVRLAERLGAAATISTAAARLFFQGAGQEVQGVFPGIRRIVGTITRLVDGVFKGVAGVGIDDDLNLLA
jgi:hypothetical protein